MADAASLVKRFLHRDCQRERLNYYTLLGVEEFLDDRTTIALAIESSIELLRQADRQTDPQSFEQIVKLVRQARSTLLDENKKREYDTHLRHVREKSATPSHPHAVLSEALQLQAVLPLGDPTSPFSMSEFLKQPPTEFRKEETVAERHFALIELARLSNDGAPQRPVSKQLGSSKIHSDSKLPIPPARTVKSNSTSRELQASIRRNRQRKNLIASGTILGVSLAILGAGAWLFYANQDRDNRIAAAPREPEATSNVANVEPSTPPSFSDEPTEDSNSNRMNLGFGTKQNRGKVGDLPKLGFQETIPSDNSEVSNPNPSPVPVESVPSPPNMQAETPTPSTNSSSTSDPTPTSEQPSPAQIENDHKAWLQAMKTAHQSIMERKDKEYTDAITLALGFARSDVETEQAKQLDRLGQLLQKGEELIRESLVNLKAGTEIAFGSTIKVSIVEAKQDSIIVKDRGKNQTYLHTKIPTAFLVSILDFALNDTPMDIAIRGVIYAVDPRSSPVTKSQASALLEKAASQDTTFQGLNAAILGKYE